MAAAACNDGDLVNSMAAVGRAHGGGGRGVIWRAQVDKVIPIPGAQEKRHAFRNWPTLVEGWRSNTMERRGLGARPPLHRGHGTRRPLRLRRPRMGGRARAPDHSGAVTDTVHNHHDYAWHEIYDGRDL